MSSRKISQFDARRFRKERDDARERIEAMIRRGRTAYGGTHIGGQTNVSELTIARLRTAKQLGYALFVTVSDDADRVDFRAMKPGEL